MFGKGVDVFLRSMAVGERDQKIQVADSFFAAAQRTRGRDALCCFARSLDVRNGGHRCGFRVMDEEAARGFLEDFHGYEDVLLALFPEAGEVAKFTGLREFLN